MMTDKVFIYSLHTVFTFGYTPCIVLNMILYNADEKINSDFLML